MPANRQLGLPPMGLHKLVTAVSSGVNPIATPPEVVEPRPVDLCAIWIRAFLHHGLSKEHAAGLLGMSPTNFSKAFNRDWPSHNPVMKRLSDVDSAMLRTFTVFLAAELGLTIGSDSELMAAKAAFADAHLKLVEVATK